MEQCYLFEFRNQCSMELEKFGFAKFTLQGLTDEAGWVYSFYFSTVILHDYYIGKLKNKFSTFCL